MPSVLELARVLTNGDVTATQKRGGKREGVFFQLHVECEKGVGWFKKGKNLKRGGFNCLSSEEENSKRKRVIFGERLKGSALLRGCGAERGGQIQGRAWLCIRRAGMKRFKFGLPRK